MAKKSRKKTKTATRPRAKSAPAMGPLTLEEAQAVTRASQPKTAAKAALRKFSSPTSPAAVGAKRRELVQKQKDEIATRTREYTAVMRLLKKRGVRAPDQRKGKGAAIAKPAIVPLQVFAEGDSWFDYPVPLFGGGIVPRLQSKLGVPILNLAAAGDEVREMLSVEQRKKLLKHFKDGCPAGGSWDVLLFSGGGNDIVGDRLALWVREWDSSKSPTQHLVQDRFDAALTLVRSAYKDLIALRDQFSPATHLIFHAYDYAIPDGRGVCFFGPWLKPSFDLRKFPTPSAAQQVVKLMIDQFANMLADLAQADKVTFIRTPGSLAPSKTSWHNELHPSKDGFKMFTTLFYTNIKQLFPNKVT